MYRVGAVADSTQRRLFCVMKGRRGGNRSAKCEGDQTGEKCDQAENGHREEGLRSEFFTHRADLGAGAKKRRRLIKSRD